MFNFLRQELNNKQRFNFILFGVFFFILPVMLSNTLYFDDNSRVLTGRAYWDVDGRPFTDIVFYFLNSSFNTISNIQPLPLLLSTLVLSLGIYYVTDKTVYKKTIFNILPFFALVCNPFFLQNLSYQFDCIGMSLSMTFLLFSFFYTPDKNKKYTYLYPVVFFFVSNCFYQPISNVFLTLFFSNIIIQFKNYRSLITETLYSAAVYSIGIVSYYISSLYIFPVKVERGKIISLQQLPESLTSSTQQLVKIVSPFLHDYLLIFIMLSVFLISMNYIYAIYNNYKKEESFKLFAGIITLISPIGLFLSLWGPFLFITELFFNPREFPSIGVFFLISLLSLKRIDVRQYISNTFILFFILALFSFSYIYGNTISNQRSYENSIYQNITNDINGKEDLALSKRIEIYGETGIAPKALNAYESHPFLYILAKPSYRWVQRYEVKALGLNQVSTNVSFDDYKEWNNICKNHIKPEI